jgi:hypothetical protein
MARPLGSAYTLKIKQNLNFFVTKKRTYVLALTLNYGTRNYVGAIRNENNVSKYLTQNLNKRHIEKFKENY